MVRSVAIDRRYNSSDLSYKMTAKGKVFTTRAITIPIAIRHYVMLDGECIGSVEKKHNSWIPLTVETKYLPKESQWVYYDDFGAIEALIEWYLTGRVTHESDHT